MKNRLLSILAVGMFTCLPFSFSVFAMEYLPCGDDRSTVDENIEACNEMVMTRHDGAFGGGFSLKLKWNLVRVFDKVREDRSGYEQLWQNDKTKEILTEMKVMNVSLDEAGQYCRNLQLVPSHSWKLANPASLMINTAYLYLPSYEIPSYEESNLPLSPTHRMGQPMWGWDYSTGSGIFSDHGTFLRSSSKLGEKFKVGVVCVGTKN